METFKPRSHNDPHPYIIPPDYASPGWRTRTIFTDEIVCGYCGHRIPGHQARIQTREAAEHRTTCPA